VDIFQVSVDVRLRMVVLKSAHRGTISAIVGTAQSFGLLGRNLQRTRKPGLDPFLDLDKETGCICVDRIIQVNK
jgi:hypothetical protein